MNMDPFASSAARHRFRIEKQSRHPKNNPELAHPDGVLNPLGISACSSSRFTALKDTAIKTEGVYLFGSHIQLAGRSMVTCISALYRAEAIAHLPGIATDIDQFLYAAIAVYRGQYQGKRVVGK